MDPHPYRRLQVAFRAGLSLAAAGVLWILWPVAGVDPNYSPFVQRPAYGRRGPRVLVDEAHGNTHTAAGRYRPLARLLARDGYKVERSRERLIPEVLETCGVLIVAHAEGIEPEEVEAVLTWVSDGGGLLLVSGGDPLAERLGLRIGGMPNSEVLLAGHAILCGRSLHEEVRRLVVLDAPRLSPETAANLIVDRAAAVERGRGRAVVLTDAELLGASVTDGQKHGLNDRRKHHQQFALNIMHWLSRVY
jgi:hypothetical protein